MNLDCFREISVRACFALTCCFSAAVNAMERPEQESLGTRKPVILSERGERAIPSIITLSGLPGSGKSTLARALLVVFDELGLKAAWYNQDEFGGDRGLFQAALGEMDRLDFVIVDRGNHDAGTRALAYDVRREFMQRRGFVSDVDLFDFLISFPFEVTEILRTRGIARTGHHTLAAEKFNEVAEMFAGLHKPVARNEPVSRAQEVCLEVDSTRAENLKRCLSKILEPSLYEAIKEDTILEAIDASMMYEGIIADMNIPHLGFNGLPKKGRPSSIGIKISRECLGVIQNLFQASIPSAVSAAGASEFDSAEKSAFLPDNVLANKVFPHEFYCAVKDTHGATDVKWFVKHWTTAKALFGQTVNLSIQRIIWDANAVLAVLNLPTEIEQFVGGSIPYVTLAAAPGVEYSYAMQMPQSEGLSVLELDGSITLQGAFGAEYPVIAEKHHKDAKAGGRGYSAREQSTAGGRGRGRSHDSAYVGGRGGRSASAGGRGGSRGYSDRGSNSSDWRAGK